MNSTPALLAGVVGFSGGSCFVFTTPVEEPAAIYYFVREVIHRLTRTDFFA